MILNSVWKNGSGARICTENLAFGEPYFTVATTPL